MADTIGDVFSRGYRSGRAIGDDFSEWKYSRGERKVRQRVEQEAKAAGQTVDEYLTGSAEGALENRLAQVEAELRDLYSTSGAARRGVTDRSGSALNTSATSRLQTDVATGIGRRASSAELAGKPGDAAGVLARGAAAFGDRDMTRQYVREGNQIANATGATGADGAIDPLKFYAGQASEQARYGEGTQSMESTAKVREMRYQIGGRAMSAAAQMLANIDKFERDQVIGTLQGALDYFPDFGDAQVQSRPNGDVWVQFSGGAAFPVVENGKVSDEAYTAMASIASDPGSFLPAKMKEFSDTRAANAEMTQFATKEALEATTKVITDMTAISPDLGKATEALTVAQQNAAKSGWQTEKLEEGATYLRSRDGQQIVLRANPAGARDPQTNQLLPPVTVTTPDGRPINMEQLDSSVQQVAQAQIQMVTEVAKLGSDAQIRMAQVKLQALGQIFSGYGVNVNAGSALQLDRGGRGAGNAQEAKAVFDEIEAKYNLRVTDYMRTPEQNASTKGSAANSQHMGGTAIDFGLTDKSGRPLSREQIAQVEADMRARGFRGGYTTRGTAPHFHFELDRGARAMGAPAPAGSTAAASAALPASKPGASRQPAAGEDPIAAMRSEGQRLDAAVREAQTLLDEFDASEGTRKPGAAFAKTGMWQTERSPEQENVRQQLVRQLDAAQRARQQFVQARQSEQALDTKAAEGYRLQRQYGGRAPAVSQTALRILQSRQKN